MDRKENGKEKKEGKDGRRYKRRDAEAEASKDAEASKEAGENGEGRVDVRHLTESCVQPMLNAGYDEGKLFITVYL